MTSAMPTRLPLRVAIDVGGTFTDVAVLDEDGLRVTFDKTSTTPADPAKGVLDCFAKARAPLAPSGTSSMARRLP